MLKPYIMLQTSWENKIIDNEQQSFLFIFALRCYLSNVFIFIYASWQMLSLYLIIRSI